MFGVHVVVAAVKLHLSVSQHLIHQDVHDVAHQLVRCPVTRLDRDRQALALVEQVALWLHLWNTQGLQMVTRGSFLFYLDS